MKKMTSFKEFKKELLSDPEVKKEYDTLEPEFAVIRQVIERRIAQEDSQASLAKKIGTKQSAISRFESGSYNPTMKFMHKIADALGVRMKVTFEEKE